MFPKPKAFTPESFEKRSGQILSVFTSTIDGLETENDKALIQTDINKQIIEQKTAENERIEKTVNSNKNFVTNLRNLLNTQ